MTGQTVPRALFGRSDRTAVLRLEGPVRYTMALALRAFVDDALARAPAELVVVDLRATTFVDSTGLGLIARLGRLALSRSGRRAVIVSGETDVMTVLRSAALDVLFVVVEEPPGELPSELAEVPLLPPKGEADAVGRVILDAHRDLAGLSKKNHDEYRGVIAALEVELAGAPLGPGQGTASTDISA